MAEDGFIPAKRCANVVIKRHYGKIDYKFFSLSDDPDSRDTAYVKNYHRKPMKKNKVDIELLHIMEKYHPDIDAIDLSQLPDSEWLRVTTRRDAKPRPRNALDDLLDEELGKVDCFQVVVAESCNWLQVDI